MRLALAKWGNSLALRLPTAVARELGVQPGSEVEAKLQHGELLLRPIEPPKYRLDDLLARITPANRHDEIDWGKPAGLEVW